MPSIGWPLLSPFSWAMKMATTKANQENAVRVQGMLDETDPLNSVSLCCDVTKKSINIL